MKQLVKEEMGVGGFVLGGRARVLLREAKVDSVGVLQERRGLLEKFFGGGGCVSSSDGHDGGIVKKSEDDCVGDSGV